MSLDAQTENIFANVDKFTVQQKVHLLEAGTCGCCESANEYSVFDGTHDTRLLVVKERSDLFNRVCCAPTHNFMLDVIAVDPTTGNELFQVMTVEREACCNKPCIGCFACGSGCSDKVTLHVGRQEGPAGKVLSTDSVIGVVQQPTNGGGGLHPTLLVMDRDGMEEKALKVRGPTCFGGCSECCCDVDFKVDEDRALIRQTKPSSMQGALRGLMTDSDAFTIEIKDKTMTPLHKAQLIGAMLLGDYMFFERDTDMISCENGALTFNLCNCFCFGCLCPWCARRARDASARAVPRSALMRLSSHLPAHTVSRRSCRMRARGLAGPSSRCSKISCGGGSGSGGGGE